METTNAESILDGVQLGLDVAGLIPGLGEPLDAINAGINLARGNYADAALSLAAMYPFGGQAATATKLGRKAGAAVLRNLDKADDAVVGISKMGDDVREAVRVASDRQGVQPAVFVRRIEKGEKFDDLVQEVAERTYQAAGNEHAVVRFTDGTRGIVQGGSGGIDMTNVDGIYLHTHPRPTGPSQEDFQMLEVLDQPFSYIYELFGGGLTRFDRIQ